jgi:hypothetical protein
MTRRALDPEQPRVEPLSIACLTEVVMLAHTFAGGLEDLAHAVDS